MQNNPLLKYHSLPPFDQIKLKHIEPSLNILLTSTQHKLQQILQTPLLAKTQKKQIFSWENLMAPLEEMLDQITNMWTPVHHLNGVMNSESLRKIHENGLIKLCEFSTELLQNKKLYQAIQSLSKSAGYKKLDAAQKKIIQNKLRDFRLAGVHLPPEKKEKLIKLNKQLAQLGSQFQNNVLDATQHWNFLVRKKEQLKNLPPTIIDALQNSAKQHHMKGYLLTLDFPIYLAIMKYVEDKELRKIMYEAYVTRASNLGPNAGVYDNTLLIKKILHLRHQIVSLLGFKNYADYSLVTKMAKHPNKVITFSNQIVKKVRPFAKKEFNDLQKFAKKEYGIKKLNAWDIAYYSEKLNEKLFHISEEKLRPYFPEKKVFEGLFYLVEKLFNIKIKPQKTKHIWHRDVQLFKLCSQSGKIIGYLYTDLYIRPTKRCGAWMDEARVHRIQLNKKLQLPVAYLTCNFNQPTRTTPSLLTHDEINTLFHEFGHCLQHLLTKINYAGVSGINGVEWDAVELCSQWFELFCWQKEIIPLISKHYKTGEPLPHELLDQLIKSKNFQSGLGLIRQLEMGLFDLLLHKNFNPKKSCTTYIHKLLQSIHQKIGIIPQPKFNRSLNSFLHIFGDSYAAGYYSYLWADVLASDAFSKFEERGVLNATVGRQFLHEILEVGGSREAMQSFVKFRGRKPKINAFLKQLGLNKN
jgi:oligopeptidase A